MKTLYDAKLCLNNKYGIVLRKYFRYQTCQALKLCAPVKWQKTMVPKIVYRQCFKLLYRLSV